MKGFFYGLIVFLLITVIVYGKFHYDQKIADTVNNSLSSNTVQNEASEGEVAANEETLDETLEGAEEVFAEKMRSTVGEGEPLTIVVAGSSVINDQEEESFPALLLKDLQEKYQTDQIKMEVVDFKDQTSLDVLDNEEANQIAALEPDVFIFAPLVLNDDGLVSMDDTLYSMNDIVQTVEKENPDVATYIQPPQPVYENTYYVDRIEQLQNETASNDVTYINHWESWPEAGDEAMDIYFEGSEPTLEGHKRWADHLFTFFTNQPLDE
ncbi:hypothetical protein [Alteribacillus sp. YIM 98480]|uniref:SGNH/GDSL hydrolase family protein n=1 Tax=Alteribacillus sp. YIM 98480 TaxID=2606599 RepID=UPI00131B5FEB|nr:hypothetical protein [Alteribacillus sp. YIM 98480]